MYPCSFCELGFTNRHEVINHLRNIHGAQVLQITCPFCDKVYNFMSYCNHLRDKHDPPLSFDMYNREEITIDHGNDDFEVGTPPESDVEVEEDEPQEELVVFPEEEEIQENTVPPKELLILKAQAFRDKCFEKWLQFSSHPDATEKSAAFCCDLILEAAMDAISCCKPYMDDEAIFNVETELRKSFGPLSSEYLRKKYLKDQGYFVPAKRMVIDYEHNTTATSTGLQMKERKQEIAVPSIKQTLLAVLNNSEIADSMVMPSDFENNDIWSHPLCGSRAQDIRNALGGEDYLAIQLFMDEFTTTCPIGSAATVYKMSAFYIRLLNFPVDLLSKLDHIFLSFLGHSADVMGDLQQQISKTILVELKQLERNGIILTYRGVRRQFKVILLTLAGDNLGIHQLGALSVGFSGNNPCRMCTVTASNLKGKYEIPNQGYKTCQIYDAIIARGNEEEMASWGIRAPCAFNELEHFHFFKNKTVDIMHDLLEGHFQRVIPLVIREAMKLGYSLERINYAIKDFGYLGSDKENQIPTISIPPRAPDTGDVYKSTANEISTLIKLLPLIFHFAGIIMNGRIWEMFMKLQRIIDIIWSHKTNEATTVMLGQLWKTYTREFHECGGNMTVKAHIPLHYPAIIREMGPLRFLSSMRFEGKHRGLKKRAKVNRCHINLPMTLASKSVISFAYSLYQMRKGNYLTALRESRAQGKYKRGLAVVYDQNVLTREPVFGEIESLLSRKILNLKCLKTTEFDERTHCYVVESTVERLQIPVESLITSEPIPIYMRRKKYIRFRENLL